MRASLRDLALQRLGATDIASALRRASAAGLVRRWRSPLPTWSPEREPDRRHRIVTNAANGRVASGVQIYGVDDAFWSFHAVPSVALSGREAALSDALAGDLGIAAGGDVILRAAGPSDIPLGTLQGRRDEGAARIRATVTRTLTADRMGSFSLQPGQGPVAAVFVSLSLLQRELGLAGRVNTILVQHGLRAGAADTPEAAVGAIQRAWLAGAALPDYGVRIRRVPGDRVMALEGLGGYIHPDVVSRVEAAFSRVQRPGIPALTYVANAIRSGDRAIPYSTVTAIDVDGYNRLSVPTGPPAPEAMSDGDPLVRGSLQVNVGRGGARVGRVQVTEAGRTQSRSSLPARAPRAATSAAGAEPEGPIWLNEWAANDLDARPGDAVELEVPRSGTTMAGSRPERRRSRCRVCCR